MSINSLYRYKESKMLSAPLWVVIFTCVIFLFENESILNLVQSKTRIDVYQNSEHCKENFHSNIQSYMCFALEKRANKISETMIWDKEVIENCSGQFEFCAQNKRREIAPSMISFGVVIHDGEYHAFPLFVLKSQEAMVSGNGYPFHYGINKVPKIKDYPNSIFKSGKSIYQNVCTIKDDSTYCKSRLSLIKSPTKYNMEMLFYTY